MDSDFIDINGYNRYNIDCRRTKINHEKAVSMEYLMKFTSEIFCVYFSAYGMMELCNEVSTNNYYLEKNHEKYQFIKQKICKKYIFFHNSHDVHALFSF